MRESIEQASLPALKALAGWPKWLPFLLILALMVAGILIPGFGWILIALVGLALAWLLYLAWPRLTAVDRLMRFAIIAIVFVAAITRANPRTGA